MTARDLLQRRSTNSRGESIWEPTPLSTAMEFGRLCILDGLHRLPAGTIAALVRLIQDREVSLYDGTRFISTRRWEYLKSISSEEELLKRKVRPVHPSFRILGLAAPPEARGRRWLSNEVMQLFHYFVLPLEQNMYSIVKIITQTSSNLFKKTSIAGELLGRVSKAKAKRDKSISA